MPDRLQVLARWSRVQGDSGTLGVETQSTEELSAAVAYYSEKGQGKLVLDATYLNGSPISSSSLDIEPGNTGWLLRSQIQFAF